MELDEIKKIWSEMDALKEKVQINDNRIKEMLKNTGKSALAKLITMAKFGIFAAIPLGLFLCLLSYSFFKAGGYYPIWPLLFFFFCISSLFIDVYLYRLLKEIDFSRMTVRDVSERILKYQSIIQKFQIFGMIFFIVYLSVWYYLFYKLTLGSEIVWPLIIMMIVMCLGGLIGIPFLYKKLYFNHINRIKESLKELKEFEEL